MLFGFWFWDHRIHINQKYLWWYKEIWELNSTNIWCCAKILQIVSVHPFHCVLGDGMPNNHLLRTTFEMFPPPLQDMVVQAVAASLPMKTAACCSMDAGMGGWWVELRSKNACRACPKFSGHIDRSRWYVFEEHPLGCWDKSCSWFNFPVFGDFCEKGNVPKHTIIWSLSQLFHLEHMWQPVATQEKDLSQHFAHLAVNEESIYNLEARQFRQFSGDQACVCVIMFDGNHRFLIYFGKSRENATLLLFNVPRWFHLQDDLVSPPTPSHLIT